MVKSSEARSLPWFLSIASKRLGKRLTKITVTTAEPILNIIEEEIGYR
jgi:hypothetical protein